MSWVRVDDLLPDHPKVEAAGDQAGWLFVCGLCYCSRSLTDGFIPSSRVAKLTGLRHPGKLAERLVSAALWEPVEGGYQVHDYHDYQPSAARVQDHRDRKAKRQARWRRGRVGADVDTDVDPSTDASVDGAVATRVDGGVAPSPRARTPQPTTTSEADASDTKNPPATSELSSLTAVVQPATAAKDKPEHRELCELLAGLIEQNGSKRPRITKRWLDAARLLSDDYGLDEVRFVLRWSQIDEFWRTNILSMPKLRAQFDQLKLKARRQPPPTKAQRIDRNVQALRQLGGAA